MSVMSYEPAVLDERGAASVRRAYGSLVNLTSGEMLDLWRRAHTPLSPLPELPMEREALISLAELQKKRSDQLNARDHRLMAQAAQQIQRLLNRRPRGNVEHSAWRLRLMFLGHDPLRSTR